MSIYFLLSTSIHAFVSLSFFQSPLLSLFFFLALSLSLSLFLLCRMFISISLYLSLCTSFTTSLSIRLFFFLFLRILCKSLIKLIPQSLCTFLSPFSAVSAHNIYCIYVFELSFNPVASLWFIRLSIILHTFALLSLSLSLFSRGSLLCAALCANGHALHLGQKHAK